MYVQLNDFFTQFYISYHKANESQTKENVKNITRKSLPIVLNTCISGLEIALFFVILILFM